jgi:hypothetical protein
MDECRFVAQIIDCSIAERSHKPNKNTGSTIFPSFILRATRKRKNLGNTLLHRTHNHAVGVTQRHGWKNSGIVDELEGMVTQFRWHEVEKRKDIPGCSCQIL